MSPGFRSISLYGSILCLIWIIGKELGFLEPVGHDVLANALMSVLAINAFVMACAFCKAKYLPLVVIDDERITFARPFFRRRSLPYGDCGISAVINGDKVEFVKEGKRILRFSLFGISATDKNLILETVRQRFGCPSPEIQKR